MENIERTHFMVLTGHLDDQPLPDLFRTLRVQRKSGRLRIEYTDAPGAFFFEDGQLVDAQLGSLHGLEAVYAALALDGASFNFNPLVRPPERSIDRQQQKFISDMVESPRRGNLSEVRLAGGAYPATAAALPDSSLPAPLQLAPVAAELVAPLEVRLTAVEEAINATSRRFSRERLVYAVIISFLVGLSAVTAMQAFHSPRPPLPTEATPPVPKPDATANPATTVNDAPAAAGAASGTPVKIEGSRRGTAPARLENAAPPPAQITAAAVPSPGATKRAEPTPPPAAEKPAPTPRPNATPVREARQPQPQQTGSGPPAGKDDEYIVHVLMAIKNGKVTQARVLNPRDGGNSYESLALRMAKQRRYPASFNGEETLTLRVKP